MFPEKLCRLQRHNATYAGHSKQKAKKTKPKRINQCEWAAKQKANINSNRHLFQSVYLNTIET